MSRRQVRQIRQGGWIAAVLAAGMLVTSLPATAADVDDPDQPARRLGFQLVPKGSADQRLGSGPVQPNPLLSLLPDPSAVDVYSWKATSAARSAARRAAMEQVPRAGRQAVVTPLPVEDVEPAAVSGVNDTPATA